MLHMNKKMINKKKLKETTNYLPIKMFAMSIPYERQTRSPQ